MEAFGQHYATVQDVLGNKLPALWPAGNVLGNFAPANDVVGLLQHPFDLVANVNDDAGVPKTGCVVFALAMHIVDELIQGCGELLIWSQSTVALLPALFEAFQLHKHLFPLNIRVEHGESDIEPRFPRRGCIVPVIFDQI